MGVDFYPVSAGVKPIKDKYKDKYISWQMKDSLYSYNRMLVSYYYGNKINRDECGDNIKEIIGDSGGFQIMAQGVDINPSDVINWQNDVCDIGFTLDIPPFNIKTNTFVRGEEFDKCMRRSNDNANVMMENKAENLKLYLVIQGSNYQERQKWLEDGIKEHDDWDGYAISPKPLGNPRAMVDSIYFAYENNLKNIHLLGQGSKTAFEIIVYFSKYFSSVKIDSSSHTAGGRFRSYYLPYLNSKITLNEKNSKVIKSLPCDCDVCRRIDDMSVFGLKTSVPGFLINSHNLCQFNRYIDMLKSLVNDEKTYKSIISPVSRKLIEETEHKIKSGASSLGDWV